MGQGGAVSNDGGVKNKKPKPIPSPYFIFNLSFKKRAPDFKHEQPAYVL